MHKLIDADYFGYRDEDNGDLLKAEALAEKLGTYSAINTVIMYFFNFA